MNKEKKIRRQILRNIKTLSRLKQKSRTFVAGKTPVNYSGRVYNYKEMVALMDASLDFWLTAGKYAHEFEKKFSELLGIKYCLLTNSGSSANLLAVSALTSPLLGKRRINPGEEIITTACGFPTTVNPIIQNNLVPVFIDIDKSTYNIQVDKIERAITRKTKAIFIAHTLGNPADIESILKIVKQYNLWFIEDNSDALGAMYKSKYTGTFGHMSTYSFYPAHHITMGEGGAVATSDPLLKKIIISFRDWGRACWCEPGHDNACRRRFKWQAGTLPFGYDHKYIYSHIGYNLKITDMQAAVGCVQLEKLNRFIKARKKNFNYLYAHLKKYEKYFFLSQPTRYSDPSWFGFPILLKENAPFTRANIVNYLEKSKIATRMLFGGNLTKQPAYRAVKYRVIDSLENTDIVMNNLFWIGVYPGLNKERLDYVNSVFENFIARIETKKPFEFPM